MKTGVDGMLGAGLDCYKTGCSEGESRITLSACLRYVQVSELICRYWIALCLTRSFHRQCLNNRLLAVRHQTVQQSHVSHSHLQPVPCKQCTNRRSAFYEFLPPPRTMFCRAFVFVFVSALATSHKNY